MKKSALYCSVVIISALSSYSAVAAEQCKPNWYGALSGGVSKLEDIDAGGGDGIENKTGGIVSLAFGKHISEDFRLEGELGYHFNGMDSVTVASTTFPKSQTTILSYMANAYYDFNNDSGFTPYLGAGIGGANVRTESSTNSLAWQLMTGIGYTADSMPQAQWTLGYRYFRVQNTEVDTPNVLFTDGDLESHNVELGVRFPMTF
ncbi:MAG: porin family protein [Alphaproteobacteria bacterium]|nr:porin family protein [Alphaproteobacteria bacterium]